MKFWISVLEFSGTLERHSGYFFWRGINIKDPNPNPSYPKSLKIQSRKIMSLINRFFAPNRSRVFFPSFDDPFFNDPFFHRNLVNHVPSIQSHTAPSMDLEETEKSFLVKRSWFQKGRYWYFSWRKYLINQRNLGFTVGEFR